VLGHGQRDAPADAQELLLERLVGERDQEPAAIADEVMVMSGAVADRLVEDGSPADFDARDELSALELLDDPVDAGARDGKLLVRERLT